MKNTPVFLRVIATLWVFLMLFIAVISAFILQIIALVLLWPIFVYSPVFKTKTMSLALRIPMIIFPGWLNPFWRMRVIRPRGKNFDGKRVVYMSNHLSGADPFIYVRMIFPFHNKAIYKADLHKIPIAGWSLALAEDVPVYFTKDKGGWGTVKGSVAQMMSRCQQVLNVGCCPAVYPEGTRSRDGRLQPFKDGFFRFAIENGASIAPIATLGQNELWPLNSKLMDVGTFDVMYGEPISSEGKTVEQLKKETRDAFIALQKLSPQYDEARHAAHAEDWVPPARGESTL